MVILRILTNAVIMVAEAAAVVGIAAFAIRYPFIFAGVTAAISLLFGMWLEVARLRYEYGFYFGSTVPRSAFLTAGVGFIEAAFKALLTGVACLLTFSGTDSGRLFWVAVVFGACIYVGASVLRLISIKADGNTLRWGYFRLATVLGLLFSMGVTAASVLGLLPHVDASKLGWQILVETPERPSVAQISELLFQIKATFDQFVLHGLSQVMSVDWARVVAIVISVNMLSGFVSALYAALIATAVRKAEDTLL
ncbi:hypothetical protein [Hyphomicrobium sp. D-2]|uniref:hypothetical protein n=1 Tax=Hyphomicrobium sp. D-2 TaxID=3041621 RepID=UPI00245883E3|nr:hypothetical protein [Hyphomicrobium sp. D-2]MDH4981631.1 hypothetical protein [Hyphomicrobium sp. D-2]